MASLTPDLALDLLDAIKTNAEEAAGAIGRAFDGEYVLKPGMPGALEDDALAVGGLVLAFKFGEAGMLAVLPAAGELVPEWTKAPDPTGASKLTTLSQELSMLLVPDTLMADAFEAAWSDDLKQAIAQAQPNEDTLTLPIEVARGEQLSSLTLIWPVTDADAALGRAEAEAPETATDESPPAAEAAPEPETPGATDPSPEVNADKPQSDGPPDGGKARVLRWTGPPPRDFRDLPPNTLSALQVRVPVSVNLAGKRMRVSDVVELGPGSIITFDKPCDAPLEVAVEDLPVATGEAVKVGERFGVRIQEMILPDEHFRPLLGPKLD